MTRLARLVRNFVEQGQAVDKAHRAVNEAFRDGLRGRDPAAYDALRAEFRRMWQAAVPFEPGRLGAEIKAGDARALDTAVAFLVADPWFFRSGYIKGSLIRHVKRANLTDADRQMPRQVVLAVIDGRDRREFRDYCHLAIALAAPEFVADLEARTASLDAGIARRAGWVLQRLVDAKRVRVAATRRRC